MNDKISSFGEHMKRPLKSRTIYRGDYFSGPTGTNPRFLPRVEQHTFEVDRSRETPAVSVPGGWRHLGADAWFYDDDTLIAVVARGPGEGFLEAGAWKESYEAALAAAENKAARRIEVEGGPYEFDSE